ncbi:MAG: hypothetical protein JNJ44_11975 [Zoogloeaceae bacterium]|nr:hypothetical protein [Zoogloeaceae bacterium]
MKKRIKASLIAASIAALPFGADAAGLGRLNVLSALGQPLRAEVELTATAQEMQSISARVPSPEAFKQANVAYSAAIADLRLSVEQRGGRSVVRITSSRPVNEPFVDLLVELNWTGGQMRREYTFLLDPADVLPARPVVATAAPVARPVVPAAAVAAKPTVGSSSGRADSDSYLVKNGDTLRHIAEQTRPEGVSLDQMVVALFRKNRDAFIADNINRLQAGKILSVPDGPSAKSITATEARKEIVAHSADFDAYRKSLASAVTASAAQPAPAPAGQVSAGQITPKVAEPSASTGARDQVRVSSGEGGKGGEAPASARLQALEEDIVARDKALQEANARLAELERNIQELQRLVELKNQGMAQAQQATQGGAASLPPAPVPAAAPAAPSAEAPPAAASAPPPPPKPIAPPPAAEQPGFLASLFDDPMTLAGGGGILALLLGYFGLRMRNRKPSEPPEEPLEVVPPPSTAPSVAPSVMGAVGGQSVDTSNVSVLQTDFGQGGLAAIDADEGVDPVAEADVYMAYGRDAQAEEILIDALKVDPTRGAVFVKLLEIYAHRKSLKQFESLATDFYGMTGGHGPDWEKAAAIGRKLDPANPLFADGQGGAESHSPVSPTGTAAAAAVAAAAVTAQMPELDDAPSETASIKDTWALPGEIQQFVGAGDVDVDLSASLPVVPGGLTGKGQDSAAHSLEFNLDLDAPSVGKDENPATPEPDAAGLDFNLDVGPDTLPGDDLPKTSGEVPEDPAMISTMVDSDMFRLDLDAPDEGAKPKDLEFELPSESKPAEPIPDLAATSLAIGITPEEAVDDPEATKVQSNLLEFDFDLDDTPSATPVPAIDLSGIDLNLDEPLETAAAPEGVPGDLEDQESGSEEIETKLELARAYEDMGDREGARELLEEVLKEGTTGQQNAARTLLAKIA